MALLVISLIGLLVAAISATAVQVLHEFARHKLEEYCRRRGKLSWFSLIIDAREEFALGAQTLQMIAIAVCVTSGLTWFFTGRAATDITSLSLFGLIGLWSLALLAANCWVPWGVLRISAPSFLYRTWRLWWLTAQLLKPLMQGVEVVSMLFHRATGQQEIEEDEEEAFEDEIRSMVSEGESDGLLDADARDMIEGVIELDDSTVSKVMTPRSKVDALDANANWNEMLSFVVEVGRTRIPVYQHSFKRHEDILGILFAKDLLGEFAKPQNQRMSIRQLVRRPLVVPTSTLLDEMLQRFLDQRNHMAIVVDEYGAVAGVITIEDILEEIVGEIVDETDVVEPSEINRINDRIFEVDGTVSVADLNQEFGLNLPNGEDFETVSGLVMSTLGRIPKPGQALTIGDVQIDVQQASRRVIERVKVTLLEPHEQG